MASIFVVATRSFGLTAMSVGFSPAFAMAEPASSICASLP